MQVVLAVLLTMIPVGGTFSGEGHRNGSAAVAAGERLPNDVPYPGGVFGRAETKVVSVEDFRFCSDVCRADTVAYARTPAGPVPGSDNPRAVVYMQPEAQFTWTYHDRSCDLLRCSGHDIRVEDGTAEGRQIGLVAAGAGRENLSWAIPADAEPESIIRYFCARHSTVGMTGAFQVLPIGILGIAFP
jgi:hypothetical protein